MSIDKVERGDSGNAAIHSVRHKSPSCDKATVLTISLTVLTVIALVLFAIFMTCQVIYGIPVCGLNCALSCAVFASLTIACLSFVALLTAKVWTLIKLKISYKPELPGPKPITDPRQSPTPRIISPSPLSEELAPLEVISTELITGEAENSPLSDPIQQPSEHPDSDTPPSPLPDDTYGYELVPIVNTDSSEEEGMPFDFQESQNVTPPPSTSPVPSSPKKGSDDERSRSASPVVTSTPVTSPVPSSPKKGSDDERSRSASPVLTSTPVTSPVPSSPKKGSDDERSRSASPVLTSTPTVSPIPSSPKKGSDDERSRSTSPVTPTPEPIPVSGLREQVIAALPTVVLPEDVTHPEILHAILRNPDHIVRHHKDIPLPQHPFNPDGLAEIMGLFTEDPTHPDSSERRLCYGKSQILLSERPLGTVGSPSPSDNQMVLGVQANRWGAKSTMPGLSNLIHECCWSRTRPESDPRGPKPFKPGEVKYTPWKETLVIKRWKSSPLLDAATENDLTPSWNIFAQMYPPVRGDETEINDPKTCLSMLSGFYQQIFQTASSDLSSIYNTELKEGRVLQIPLFGKESAKIPAPICNAWCYVNLMGLLMGLKDFEDTRQQEEEARSQQATAPVEGATQTSESKPLTVLVNGISSNHLLNQLHPPSRQQGSSSEEE